MPQPTDHPAGGPPAPAAPQTPAHAAAARGADPPAAVPVSPDETAFGAPNPVTGEAGPPGTVAWIGNTPVDGVGQSMRDYHASRKDRPKAEAPAAPTAPPA